MDERPSLQPAAPAQPRANPSRDFAASLVVFLVALPLSMGIAIASGVPVAAGLVTGIVGGLLVGMLAGSPLQVSGPAAGLTVIVFEIVRIHGLEGLGIIVLGAGLIQFLAGLLRLGQWFRAVSPAVVEGMLAGIGILIVASQVHVMVDDAPKGSPVENLASIPEALRKGLPWPTTQGPAERRAALALIHELGTLHSDQIQVGESVAWILPHNASTEVAAHVRSGLPEIAASQTRIVDALTEIQSRLRASRLAKDSEGVALALDQAIMAATAAAEDLSAARGAAVRESQATAAAAILALRGHLKNHDWAAKIGILTIAVLLLWRNVPWPALKVIPAPLVAILAATAAAGILTLPVTYVEVPQQLLRDLQTPSWAVLQAMPWNVLLASSAVMALVASAETLLCCTAVDQLQNAVRTQYNRELMAQGAGNMVCGFLGALPLTGVIVRSAANVQAGASSRWSAVMHGLWLLVFVALLTPILRLIPVSALAAMLVYTGVRLINLRVIPELWRVGVGEVFVFLATAVTIVAEDLLTGVIVGIVLSAGKLLLTMTRFQPTVEMNEATGVHHLTLEGAATFVRLPRFAGALEKISFPSRVHVHTAGLTHVDHACWVLLLNWMRQQESAGGSVALDWDALHRRGCLNFELVEEARRERDRRIDPVPILETSA